MHNCGIRVLSRCLYKTRSFVFMVPNWFTRLTKLVYFDRLAVRSYTCAQDNDEADENTSPDCIYGISKISRSVKLLQKNKDFLPYKLGTG